MSNPYILLWLEAPLQSWGYDSKFDRRDTLEFPTKSGVLGLLCCARGAAGEQRQWLAAWSALDMRVTAYLPSDARKRPLPRQPPLLDFHMVGSGYDGQDPWQNLLVPKTSQGKKPVGRAGGVMATYRYYVQDMAYAVAMEVPHNMLDSTVEAIKSPTWDIYLGRKSCVPTEFIFQGVYSGGQEALAAGQAIAESKQRTPSLRVLQGDHVGEIITLADVPIQFGPHKRYAERHVTVQKQW